MMIWEINRKISNGKKGLAEQYPEPLQIQDLIFTSFLLLTEIPFRNCS